MTTNQTPDNTARGRLSFAALIRNWQKIAASGKSMHANICTHLLKRFAQYPELLQPADDAIFAKHISLIEEGMATIFPIALNHLTNQYAAVVPFSHKVIYATPRFKALYVDACGDVKRQDAQVENNIEKANYNLAYKIILQKFYQLPLPATITFICAYPDASEGIYNYFELECDAQFVDVTTTLPLPPLPTDIQTNVRQSSDLAAYMALPKLLPLSQFMFEGFTLVRVHEVTTRETTARIKIILEESELLEDEGVRLRLQQEIQSLLHMPDLQVGIASFNRQDNTLSQMNHASLLMQKMEPEEKVVFSNALAEALKTEAYYRCFGEMPEIDGHYSICKYAMAAGFKNIMVLALHNKEKLIGWLELCTTNTPIDVGVATTMHCVTELVEVALQKAQQKILRLINNIIKEHFTAVQATVEWKFKEAAFNYLYNYQNANTKMQSITFDQVYPLYALIDIRNSSGERNMALQQDLIQQLQWIKSILLQAQQHLQLPILKEIDARVDAYAKTVSNFLFASDEQQVQSFLKGEVEELMDNLKSMLPQTATEIEAYFEATGNRRHLLVTHQQQYEESVNEINNNIVRFLEREQITAQAIYPHYFERFVTDGVEFNMYIGQSIAPAKKFNKLYLKNLRLWQLYFLADVTQKIAALAPALPVPMETTQLILIYNDPISITFRTEERKFDVDGVYNARYEVVKKRIDKVHVKDTNERLTKPGFIAIVYTTDNEAIEYLQYIDYLKKSAMLTGEVEMLLLEELQGVSGLKALRIQVQIEKKTTKEPEKQRTLITG